MKNKMVSSFLVIMASDRNTLGNRVCSFSFSDDNTYLASVGCGDNFNDSMKRNVPGKTRFGLDSNTCGDKLFY
jgi:hypothetical protein